jgi:hypothetical protein
MSTSYFESLESGHSDRPHNIRHRGLVTVVSRSPESPNPRAKLSGPTTLQNCGSLCIDQPQIAWRLNLIAGERWYLLFQVSIAELMDFRQITHNLRLRN